MKYFNYTSLICIVILFVSCEKVVDINFPLSDDVIVIEGYVESDFPPYVILTRSVPFLGSLTPDEFANYFVTGATIKLSDGSNETTLKEYATKEGFSIYTLDTADLSTVLNFLGQEGKTYTIEAIVDVKNEIRTYTSQTTILPKVPLDSVWYEPKRDDSTLFQVYGMLSDPASQTNYYRLFTKRNNDFQYDTDFNSVFTDIIINGKSFKFTINRGKNDFANNDTADFEKYGYFEKGDTVYIKWCSIEKQAFDFWNTFEAQGGSIGNPFSSPLRIESNIKGKNTTGIWGSYGASYDTLIIQ